MKDLVIIGASGYGRELYDMVCRINDIEQKYKILGFIDDNNELWGKTINGVTVLGGLDYIKRNLFDRNICVAIAIASANVKKKIVKELDGHVIWENLIDPTAIISRFCEIGFGNLIGPFTQIGPNSKVGNFCSIVYCDSIGHDAVIEDYVSVMDYCDITGYNYLEESVYLGSSVCLIPNIRVRRESVLGAGSVVCKDIVESGTYIGVPARQIK